MRTFLTIIFLVTIIVHSKAARFYIPDGDVNALKSAINTSNTNSKADTIHLFPYSKYILNTVDNSFVFGDNALPRIEFDVSYNNSLTIMGNGASLVLDTAALDNVRIMYLEDCAVNFYDLAFINGSPDTGNNPGGAIFMNGGSNTSPINLYNCLFKGNSAYMGGAIHAFAGNFTIYNCTFIENSALFLGGAIASQYATFLIQNSVIVNNYCTNTNEPGAIHNFVNIFSPTAGSNIYLLSSIVAKNTYKNPSSPNNGLEYDLTPYTGIYPYGFNLIGSYDNTTTGTPTPFITGSPTGNSDYVGSSSAVINPMLGSFGRYTEYQDMYQLLNGSPALINHTGNIFNNHPAIASYGIFPDSGVAGDQITIYGKNLAYILEVDFQGASVYSGFTATDTSITITVPENVTSGTISVLDYNAIPGTSAQVFKIIPPVVVTDLESQKESTKFSFYPNPVSDYLTINSEGNKTSICDLSGKELLSSNAEKIDVSALPKGVYILKCGNEVERMVKE